MQQLAFDRPLIQPQLPNALVYHLTSRPSNQLQRKYMKLKTISIELLMTHNFLVLFVGYQTSIKQRHFLLYGSFGDDSWHSWGTHKQHLCLFETQGFLKSFKCWIPRIFLLYLLPTILSDTSAGSTLMAASSNHLIIFWSIIRIH